MKDMFVEMTLNLRKLTEMQDWLNENKTLVNDYDGKTTILNSLKEKDERHAKAHLSLINQIRAISGKPDFLGEIDGEIKKEQVKFESCDAKVKATASELAVAEKEKEKLEGMIKALLQTSYNPYNNSSKNLQIDINNYYKRVDALENEIKIARAALAKYESDVNTSINTIIYYQAQYDKAKELKSRFMKLVSDIGNFHIDVKQNPTVISISEAMAKSAVVVPAPQPAPTYVAPQPFVPVSLKPIQPVQPIVNAWTYTTCMNAIVMHMKLFAAAGACYITPSALSIIALVGATAIVVDYYGGNIVSQNKNFARFANCCSLAMGVALAMNAAVDIAPIAASVSDLMLTSVEAREVAINVATSLFA